MLAIGVFACLPTVALDQAGANGNDTESVADYWFRTLILQQKPKTNRVVVDEKATLENQSELALLWEKISQRIRSPLKTFIHYVDGYKTHIASVFQEPLVAGKEDAYRDVSSTNEYIAKAIPEIDETLSHGYKPTTLNFEEVQKLPFIKRTTLAGEEVRLCGIDQEVENLILENLDKHLASHGLVKLHSYYFGSRVMPRSEVVKRDPSMASSLPINDDGLVKNAVRIKGLTHISDLEMLVIVSSPMERSSRDVKKVASEFKKNFAKDFRDFPISVKLIHVPDPQVLSPDPFDFINQHYIETKNKPMSRYQFVKI